LFNKKLVCKHQACANYNYCTKQLLSTIPGISNGGNPQGPQIFPRITLHLNVNSSFRHHPRTTTKNCSQEARKDTCLTPGLSHSPSGTYPPDKNSDFNCENGIRSDKTDQIYNLARLNQTRNNTAENALNIRKNIQGSARNENWVPHRPDQNFCTINAIYTLGPNSGNDVTHHQYNAVENRFIYRLTNICSVNTNISVSTVTTSQYLHPGQRKIQLTRGNILHSSQNKLPLDTLPGKNRVGNDTRTQGSLRVHKNHQYIPIKTNTI
jgi:hypothetical protein